MTAVRVLLVDKSQEFLDAAAHFLAEDHHLVVVGRFRSTREALVQVSILQPEVVLMELEMPELSGLVTTLHLKALPHAPRVVIVTARTERPYRALAEAVQADGFIAKQDFCTQVVPLIKALTSRADALPVPS